MTYRSYGYPWRWAILAELFWRIEHVPFRCARNGIDDGPLSRIGSWGYRLRKACERRGARVSCGAEFGNPSMPCELPLGHDGGHAHSTVRWNYDSRGGQHGSSP